ncbi:TPA: type VI secretion system tip protein TssI/VgrG, partial [Salmonella enterica subsp. enterica serovar Wangata]
VRPPVWRAALRQNSRIFQNEDIKSILGTILQENGVTEWSPLFSEAHPAREFCVQYSETDYDFLARMAAEEGIFFYEEHAQTSDDQSLVLCDTVRFLPEAFEIPWNPNTRTEVSTPCISQFRHSAQIRPSSVIGKDYTFKRPGWAGRFEHQGEHQDYQRTQYEVFDYPGRFKDGHGQNFARWQMEGWRNNAEVAQGKSRSPSIWPGRRIQLTEHPQTSLNREWQVVSSDLHGSQPQAAAGRSGSGTTLDNHFTVIPADRTWRPRPQPKPSVDGPQSAVVTGPEGEEIFCDEHGRVRVKFNWDRYNPANQDSSCWIRVVQAWAGPGFGNLAIPRVGQEVIVDFLNGDPDQPIIMGRTYHQENRSPGSLPGTKTQMTIRSKTYKGSGYNELMFEDKTGQELLSMHAQKDMDTKVLHDRKTTVIHDHTENVGHNQKVRIKRDRKVLIGHNLRQVVLNNQRTTTLKHKKDFTGLTSRETVGVLKAVTVGGVYQTTVVGEMNTSVIMAQTEEVGLLKSVTVNGPLNVSSATSITFTCGASSITMNEAGVVTISGTEFNFSASGPVAIKGKDVDIN